MTERIRDMPSLGPVTERQCAKIDINTPKDLRALGPVQAYMALKFRFGRAITLNALYALDCGISGLDWRDHTDGRKADLKAAVQKLTATIKET